MAAKKTTKSIAQKTAKELFKKLGIEGDFSCEESEDGVQLVLETKDTGVVIGYHGEVLESLQLVLSIMVSKQLDSFVRIAIEVGDYKKNRSDYLEQIARSAKERALLQRQDIMLPNLKSWERRIVHLLFENDPEVTTESVGEGRERMLVVKPK